VSSNAAARERLAQLAKDLRALPRAMALEAAPVGAQKLDAVLRANISAGVAPDGSAWPLRLDGGKALQNAGDELEVKAEGTVILARISGPYALHHLGKARGHVQRRIIPTKFAPQPVVQAVEETLAEVMPRLLGLE